jgi:mannose-6-phosphate isomerase-like protein (cupin superfamily)
MPDSPDSARRPAPGAGQTWNLHQIMRSGAAFETLVGTYLGRSRPASPPPALRSLSVHYWHLAPGEVDTQGPHREDELYYVLAGHGTLTVDGDPHPLASGDLIFVPRDAPHTFGGFDGPEGLHLLVFFAPDFSG